MSNVLVDDWPASQAWEQEAATRFDPGVTGDPASLTVRDVMARDVRFCRPDDTLAAAAAAMRETDCRFLPVVDRMGHPIGILTGESICLTGFSDPQLLMEIDVRDAMGRLPATCRGIDSVSDAVKIMRERHLSHLSVVNGEDVLEGLLSLVRLGGNVSREPREQAVAALC